MFILFTLWIVLVYAFSFSDPIRPLPTEIEYDPRKALIGRELFFDTILSRNRDISCATCHDPEQGGTVHLRFSPKVSEDLKANVPTVFNAVFNFRQFWNGRAKDLYEQAAVPILNPAEMDLTKEEVEKRINENEKYRRMFKEVIQDLTDI